MNAVNVYNEVLAIATPKARINGWNIWDVRHLDRKAGWFVTCQNEDHQETYQYETLLADAKQFADSYNCEECEVEHRVGVLEGRIATAQRSLDLRLDYLENGKHLWLSDGTYSGGRHGGATRLNLWFGTVDGNFGRPYGAYVQGEVYVTVSEDGTVTNNYATETWENDERVFVEFGSDEVAFKSFMAKKLEKYQAQFTESVKESVAQTEAHIAELKRDLETAKGGRN